MRVVPRSDLRDRLVYAGLQIRAVLCLRPLAGFKLAFWRGFCVLPLVAALGLLGMTGCAGGFQGSRPEALSISGPASQTVTVGQTATFSVNATGTGPMGYQWYKNGVAISGATGSTYTTPPTVLGDSGSVFTVVVTGATGSETSPGATLTVTAVKPAIVTPPASQTVMVGQTATFNVTATGTGPLSYQWFKNGVAISGATSSTYTTSPEVSGDSGAVFTVTVSNTAGSVTSVGATLTVQIAAALAKSIVPSNATPPYNASV